MRYYSSTAGAMTLAANAAAGDTSIVVSSTTGLPVSFPYVLILDYGSGATEEIVDVTAAAGTTLTVTRGVDGTSAQSHSSGAPVRHGITARDPRESRQHEAASAGVHGLAGTVVGTTDTQTLDNKTLQSAGGGTTPLKVRAAASQTVDVVQILDSSGAVQWRSDSASQVSSDALTLRTGAGAGLFGEVVEVSPPANKDGVLVNVPTGSTGYALKVQRNAVNKALIDGDGNVTAVGATLSGPLTGTTSTMSGALSAASGAFSGAVSTGALTAASVASSGAVSGTTGSFSGNVTGPNLTATVNKAGKNLHWGAATVTTDASGFATITHGAGFTPTVVVPILNRATGGLYMDMCVDTFTATTFRIRLADSSGNLAVSIASIPIAFFCGE